MLDAKDNALLEFSLPKDWTDKVSKLKDNYLLVRSNLEDACKFKSHYYNLRIDVLFRVGSYSCCP
jgi:hypothetical protein